MVGTQIPKEKVEQIYEAIELARSTGKIKKGTNEVTKMIERGEAKLVAIASDINPPEIVMHLPMLCEEKGIPCYQVGTREELGAASGLDVSTTTVAITEEGESKSVLAKISKDVPAKDEGSE
jgi:large subunit ribosomal protein L7Ae